MRVRVLALAGLLTLTALTGCGGGDEGAESAPAASAADEAAITKTAVEVARTHDGNAATTCKTMLTEEFVTTFFSTQKACREEGGTQKKDAASGAAVTEIEVDGNSATAIVTHQGGEANGATGHWRFARDGAGWRVADWQVDFLRSYFAAGFGPNYEADGADDPLADSKIRTCLVDSFESLDDAAYVALIHEFFRQTKIGEKQFQNALLDCLGQGGAGGISALRHLFENGLRQAVANDPDGTMTPKVAECLLLKLRTSLADTEIRKATEKYIAKGGDPSSYYSPKMVKSVQTATLDCLQETPA